MSTTRSILGNTMRGALLAFAGLSIQGCSSPDEGAPEATATEPAAATPLAPIRVSGSYWIELSPVLVAANSFYPQRLTVGEGGITRITSGEADLATNAETQLLRESVKNPDLRIIMTVTESFYRIVARRSAGIETLADLKGKRVMAPAMTSANYFVEAMLRTVGLTDTDIELVPLPPAQGDLTGMDQMSDALARGDVDAIAMWEPEPEDAIHQLGDDAVVFQDRSVYREVFNLHARAPDLADPAKRRSIVAFVRAVADATAALRADPAPYWPHVSGITGFTTEEIGWGWPEMEFPVRIIPDMLDVLEVEEAWVARASNRAPRSREELAKFIDSSVVEEALALPATAAAPTPAPLVIERQGAFAVGGQVLGDAATASLHCDHGVVEYQIPADARAVNLLMWHSASAVAWQQRWDGGEGFQSLFLRRGFPVYLWDGPRVGRGNWGCAATAYEPGVGRDQQNFVAWRFGTEYPNWFDGVQFPKDNAEAWNQAMRARYQEFDTIPNAQLETDAAAVLADRIGPTVALTNSAGGLRALLTATKSDNIVGIVAYENVGWVYPEGEAPDVPQGPFGPIEVPLEQFLKLTRFPIQMVWGDNVEASDNYRTRAAESRRWVDIVNKHGGKASVLALPDAGLEGNTHIPFADLNNVAVADLLSQFLREHGLDTRARR